MAGPTNGYPATKLINGFGDVVNFADWADHSFSSGNNSLILPLSTLTIGQNETYLFTAEEGKAKKVSVEILKISGETAEVSAELPPDALGIVEGNKLVQEGEGIEIK